MSRPDSPHSSIVLRNYLVQHPARTGRYITIVVFDYSFLPKTSGFFLFFFPVSPQHYSLPHFHRFSNMPWRRKYQPPSNRPPKKKYQPPDYTEMMKKWGEEQTVSPHALRLDSRPMLIKTGNAQKATWVKPGRIGKTFVSIISFEC